MELLDKLEKKQQQQQQQRNRRKTIEMQTICNRLSIDNLYSTLVCLRERRKKWRPVFGCNRRDIQRTGHRHFIITSDYRLQIVASRPNLFPIGFSGAKTIVQCANGFFLHCEIVTFSSFRIIIST